MHFGEIIASVAAQFAGKARTGDATADRYIGALARLMTNAGRWAAVSNSGIKCATRVQSPADGSIRACGTGAMSACVACNQPTCFDHAMISPMNGDVLCHSCVATVQQMAQQQATDWQQRRAQADPSPQPPPSAGSQPGRESVPHAINLRARHLRTLNLSAGVSWEEIHAKFRKLGVRYHPDRVKTNKAKKAREVRMRKLTEAYHWLRDNRERAA